MKLPAIGVFVIVLLTACASTTLVPDDVAPAQTWGAATNVTRLKHLYFSEQPDEAAFKVAKEFGVTTVVTLRGASEIDWDEQSVVESHGMKFVRIPVSKNSDTLDSQAMADITKVVNAQNGAPVLLHCSSGNRAAAWLATHLVQDHDMSANDAIDVAHRAGLTRSGVEQRVRTFLKKSDEPRSD